MDKLFIIVTKNRSDYDEQQMIVRNSDREVVSYVSSISTSSGMDDHIEVIRVFSVTDRGKISNHEVQFKNGRLMLTEIVEVQQTQFG